MLDRIEVVFAIKQELPVHFVVVQEVRDAPTDLLENLETSHQHGFILVCQLAGFDELVLVHACIDQACTWKHIFLLNHQLQQFFNLKKSLIQLLATKKKLDDGGNVNLLVGAGPKHDRLCCWRMLHWFNYVPISKHLVLAQQQDFAQNLDCPFALGEKFLQDNFVISLINMLISFSQNCKVINCFIFCKDVQGFEIKKLRFNLFCLFDILGCQQIFYQLEERRFSPIFRTIFIFFRCFSDKFLSNFFVGIFSLRFDFIGDTRKPDWVAGCFSDFLGHLFNIHFLDWLVVTALNSLISEWLFAFAAFSDCRLFALLDADFLRE